MATITVNDAPPVISYGCTNFELTKQALVHRKPVSSGGAVVLCMRIDNSHLRGINWHSRRSRLMNTAFTARRESVQRRGVSGLLYLASRPISAPNKVSPTGCTFLATYHDASPLTVGANTMSCFWGLMSVGCFFELDHSRVVPLANNATLRSVRMIA